MTTAIDTYKAAYYHGATKTFFREFNPVRANGTFVYNDSASGAVGATSGQIAVGQFSHKELHYQPRILASGSIAVQLEGRAAYFSTWTKLRRFLLTSAAATYPAATLISEKVDFLRIGVRAASPAATDKFTCYGIFR